VTRKRQDTRGMVETPDTNRVDAVVNDSREETRTAEVRAWFIREVLPLEADLIQFLRRSGRDKSDVEDLRQDVYMRVCAAAYKEIPNPTRPLVFAVARNLLIDRVRHEQVVPIEVIENLDALNVAIEEPSPARAIIAREELRRLQSALKMLPERTRSIVVMHKLDGLSAREIAKRTGFSQRTVERSLTDGVRALAEIMLREPPNSRRAP
jgi:RNA polymerase sigma factor (sigma-70 family)